MPLQVSPKGHGEPKKNHTHYFCGPPSLWTTDSRKPSRPEASWADGSDPWAGWAPWSPSPSPPSWNQREPHWHRLNWQTRRRRRADRPRRPSWLKGQSDDHYGPKVRSRRPGGGEARLRLTEQRYDEGKGRFVHAMCVYVCKRLSGRIFVICGCPDEDSDDESRMEWRRRSAHC